MTAGFRSLPPRDAAQPASSDWHKPFEQVYDYSRPPFANWFVGGQTNLCHNAVDRHAATYPDHNALIWVSTESNQEVIYSFAQLQAEVQRMAAVLQSLGVGKGDRVHVYVGRPIRDRGRPAGWQDGGCTGMPRSRG